jgi:hypothetical protein
MIDRTDEKQAEGHMFTCRCGEVVIGNFCPHCDRPCDKRICVKCNRAVDDKKIRNDGKKK